MEVWLSAYTAALLAAAALSAGLAGLCLLRRTVPGALVFMAGNLAAACYALGSAFEIHAGDLDALMAALTLEYVGIAAIGPLWFFTVWFSQGEAKPRPLAAFWPAFIFPAVVVAAVATNRYHQLFYASVALTERGPFAVPVLDKGPLYLLNMVYMNAFLALGTALALRRAFASPRAHRKQYALLAAGALFPWTGMVVYQAGLSPFGLDVAPFGLVASGLVFTLAMFRYALFDLSPLVAGTVFDCMQEGVVVLDAEGRLVGANPAIAVAFPDLDEARIGDGPAELARRFPELAPVWDGSFGDQGEMAIGAGEGMRVLHIERSPLYDRGRRPLGSVYLFTDVTQRVRLTERLAVMATTDALTGLMNRRYFLERYREEQARALRYGRPLSLVIFDIDLFKAVNDELGHAAGDQALRHVATVCAARLRTGDVLARWGGEEFVALLPETTQVDAGRLAERLRAALAETDCYLEGGRRRITASFGAAGSDRQAGYEIDRLLRAADAALYRAKAGGRDRVDAD
jgi:diguanylate cyclase (GGDEF)-like protein